MKKIKKVLALLITLVIMSTLITSVMVSASDTTSVYPTVSGVMPEEGVEVCAYQIIKLNDTGTAYEPVITDTDTYPLSTNAEGNLSPTPDDVDKLAANHDSLDLPMKKFFKDSSGTYTYPNPADRPATTDYLDFGTWMIIIKGSGKYLYNPSILSVTKKPDGTGPGHLNLSEKVWGSEAYAKESEPDITKTAITEKSTYISKDEFIQFKITTTIPQYTDYRLSDEMLKATPLTYKIEDTLSIFTLANDNAHKPEVKIEGTANADLTSILTSAIQQNTQTFTFDLSNNIPLISANRGKKLEIIYWAQAKADKLANTSVNKLTNTATLVYSTNDATQTKSAHTIHYTFGIDTPLNINSDIYTAEFIKTDANKDGTVTFTPATATANEKITVSNGQVLSGATFEIHTDSVDGPLFATVTTTSTGRLPIVGLDSDHNYYLVETTPPDGYTNSNTTVKLVITPNEGTPLTGYTVKLNDKLVATYVYNNETGQLDFSTDADKPSPFDFKNIKLGELPSTGGIGTTIFTIGGCLLMIVAAALFFISRRKDPK